MLHRSFKPAKCKTALKLAVSRIKLLKNKKDAQVKQIKRELAQLLESGQDRTARIRVEHLLREEKTKAAYEVIEIYCELIAARLPIIESQKNCPIDLKEAITSLVFASPRCADIPELMDIRKHFTAKYGKEFISGAVELRPDCGVSRLLVEKLSTKSPDGPTKMKILTEIAKEHNVKWDPQSFEENDSKPPEDLLNGPNTFGMSSKIQQEPPPGPPPPNPVVREPLNVQTPPQSYENHDVSRNYNEQNARSSPRFRDSASSNVSSYNATTSGTFTTEVRSSGNVTDEMGNRHSVPGDGNASSSDRQNWNMEFKDAASAAQAAAESAERASVAARAAAELSRQYSSELRDKNSRSPSLTSSRASINNGPSVDRQQMEDAYPQKKSSEPENRDSIGEGSTKRQSSNTGVYASEMQTGRKPDDSSYFGDMRSEEKSSRPSSRSNSIGKMSTKRQSNNTDVYGSDLQTGIKSDNISYVGNVRSEEKSSRRTSRSSSSCGSDVQEDALNGNDLLSYLGDMRTGEQSIRSSSLSHSRNFSNDHENVPNGPGEDFFFNDANIFNRTTEANSSGNAPLVFDDSGSDDDKCKFDVEDYKAQESSLFFSSPPRNLFSPSPDLDPWSSKQRTDEVPFKSISQSSSSSAHHSPPVFEENLMGSTGSSQPNNLMPVAFDESDGPSSDSEDELDKSKLAQSTVSKFSSGKSQSASCRSLRSSSSEELNAGSTVSEMKFDYDELPTGRSSLRLRKSGLGSNVKDDFQTTKDSEVPEECSCASEIDNELKFGVLSGGFRNKGFKHPPYTRRSSGNSLSGKQVAEDTKTEQPSYSSTGRVSFGSRTSSQELHNLPGNTKLNKERSTRTPVSHVTSEEDSSEDELSHEAVSSSRDPYNEKLGSEVKASSRYTYGFFDSEDGEGEEDLLPKISTSNARPSPKLSRRTQPSSVSVRSSGSKTTVMPNVSRASDYGKASERSSYATESLPKPLSHTKSSERPGSQEWNTPVEQAVPKPVPESKRPSPVKTSSSDRISSSRSSYAIETLPKPFSQTKSSEHLESQDWHRPAEQAVPKPVPESKRPSPVETSSSDRISSSRSSYATETLPKPFSQTKSSEHPESQDWHRPAEQAVPKPVPESKRPSPVETSSSDRISSSRSSYATETLPKPFSQTKSSERPESQDWHRPAEQAVPKPVPESKRHSPVQTSTSDRNSSSRSSYAAETLPKPFSQTRSTERPGSQDWHRPAEEASRKPIPESKRSSPAETSKSYGNPSSRSSYATDTKPKPSSQTKSPDRPGSQERHRSVEQAAPKPVPESKRSSLAGTSKSFSREQSSNPRKIATARSTESPNSAGFTVENPSKEKASHVHPKLPDSDDFIAKFMALRQNRQ